jgi:hypothetical protein
MSHAYPEDQLVEQSSLGLFAELRVVQIQNLRRTRNPLLPHLLSGQVMLR